MSFFDISNLANKFAGFDIPPDAEFEQREYSPCSPIHQTDTTN